MSSSVITRFAPSPTGFLHIGGGRTALFNWAYAKNRGGKMLLRIEDTDRERSTPEAVDAILDGLTWLGLDWDGEAVSQYARASRHREVAEILLAKGHAYRCYCSPEELQAMREKAEAEKRPVRYDGTWRDRDPATAPAGVKPVIRFKSPQQGETVIEDHAQGRVVFQNKELDDLIILRSDGNPTYNLSVVVDDHDMGVTHIIRGVDHLTNAARQTQIYKAMGWHVPEMTHVPLIHGPDGAKLSKRHGALGVEAYRAMGYLPAAMRNYLARLGWSHGDDEIFSTEQMVDWFGLDAIGKSPSRFDFVKLENLNGHYMRGTPDAELLAAFITFLPHVAGGPEMLGRIDAGMKAKLLRAMPGLKERAKTLVDLMKSAQFLFAERPLTLDDKARQIMADGGVAALTALLPVLEATEWNVQSVEAAVKAHAEATGAKLGKLAQPLRAALTGTSTSPGIFDVLDVLGRAESLNRIADALKSG
ncbi:glutamate--tRNA ligase [Aestuariivirga sp. YIM B02566]|uniref:Glutamate--tRNA ligase n=1 Tax=Taklimakanibacter albus TaxID=2800327 RepID=A0ACC5R1X6_9HYPH|nr:glutamate--tRNA ligase [Aestuariivirga sp. YIM B02566]MBK1866617.1 glutamate--tRNA ligase [Aestuariivirga sp. YIM B02566]